MAVQWPLLIFSVLLGASSGILIFLGIGEIKGKFKNVRFALALTALILLAIGGCASALHLGHIDRAFYILGNMGSGLSKELFAVAFVGIMTLVYVILARKDYPGPTKVFGILAMIGAIILPIVAGASYMMPARPAWDSFTLPLMFLGTGIGMGFVLAAAFVFTKADSAKKETEGDTAKAALLVTEDDKKLAMTLALVGVVCSVAVMLIYVIWIAMAPHPDPSRSMMRLAGGDLAVAFWVCVVLIGMAGPLALVWKANKDMTHPVADDADATDGAVIAGAQDGAAVAIATPAAAKKAANITPVTALWASLACLVVGSVVLRVIMYAVATSVEQLIY